MVPGFFVELLTRIELVTSSLPRMCPRHAVLETAALPTELYPYFFAVPSSARLILAFSTQTVNSFSQTFLKNFSQIKERVGGRIRKPFSPAQYIPM